MHAAREAKGQVRTTPLGRRPGGTCTANLQLLFLIRTHECPRVTGLQCTLSACSHYVIRIRLDAVAPSPQPRSHCAPYKTQDTGNGLLLAFLVALAAEHPVGCKPNEGMREWFLANWYSSFAGETTNFHVLPVSDTAAPPLHGAAHTVRPSHPSVRRQGTTAPRTATACRLTSSRAAVGPRRHPLGRTLYTTDPRPWAKRVPAAPCINKPRRGASRTWTPRSSSSSISSTRCSSSSGLLVAGPCRAPKATAEGGLL